MSTLDSNSQQPGTGPFGVVRDGQGQETVTVLIAAFEGWNDAGDAATDSLKLCLLYTSDAADDVYQV